MPKRRERDTSNADNLYSAAADGSPSTSLTAISPTADSAGGASTTNFRNVSACNRCRNRKNRCDQKLPKCTNCDKAAVRCVGFDPVSKREIPRSYVYYLETRVRNLEALCSANGLDFPPPSEDFAISETIKPGVNVPFPVLEEESSTTVKREGDDGDGAAGVKVDPALLDRDHRDEGERLDKLVNNIGMVSVQGTPDTRVLGSASGISFAKVVFAAVKRSTNHASTPSEKSGSGGGRSNNKALPTADAASGGGTTMRDSFFGLHSKPTIKPAPFPDKELGFRLVELYFEHANPQIPVLHRGEFMALFERVYATDAKKRTARELYMLNIVFAIGSGIIMDSSHVEQSRAGAENANEPSKKRQRLASQQHRPEEYHSSAITHLESFLGSSPTTEGGSGGLEELQAVILLAGLALLRPVAPGLWYIIGVAVRLSIDLGLHFEDIDQELDKRATHPETGEPVSSGLGRKQWTRDLRRRLWWCVFNLDRLVSSCVGRPVAISESVVTIEFPSMLDDAYITPSGFLKAPDLEEKPSYKLVTRHYIRLRLLQSEILQVLQYRQAHSARQMGAQKKNEFVQRDLESPFLQRHGSFRDWRAHIDALLWEWKESAPKPFETGVAFNPLFFELNYWQAVIMLYRQSLSVPEPLANELSPATGEDVHSPSGTAASVGMEQEEDQQIVFLKVAQAGQTVLKIYRQLHRLRLVNYTFLATHHLFMSGISFLYAIWHSTLVRSQLTIDDVDFTVLAATSVLSDLAETCPPAEACRDAFMRMSKATISMVMSTTSFGNASTLGTQPLNSPDGYFHNANNKTSPHQVQPLQPPRRPMPKFDMNLKDLFSEEEIAGRPLTHRNNQSKSDPFRRGFSLRQPPEQGHASNTSPETSYQSLQQQQISSHDRASSTASSNYQQQPQAFQAPPPFTPDESANSNDFSFENLDFLNDFNPSIDQNWDTQSRQQSSNQQQPNSFGQAGSGGGMMDWDLSFGSGGTTGFEAWDANGEIFDGFFFGGGNGNAY